MKAGAFELDLVEVANAFGVLFGIWQAFQAHKRHKARKSLESSSDLSPIKLPKPEEKEVNP